MRALLTKTVFTVVFSTAMIASAFGADLPTVPTVDDTCVSAARAAAAGGEDAAAASDWFNQFCTTQAAPQPAQVVADRFESADLGYARFLIGGSFFSKEVSGTSSDYDVSNLALSGEVELMLNTPIDHFAVGVFASATRVFQGDMSPENPAFNTFNPQLSATALEIGLKGEFHVYDGGDTDVYIGLGGGVGRLDSSIALTGLPTQTPDTNYTFVTGDFTIEQKVSDDLSAAFQPYVTYRSGGNMDAWEVGGRAGLRF